MSEFYEVKPAVLEHRRRYLARPGTGVGPVHVLGAHLHPRRRQGGLDLAHSGEGRNDKGLDARVDLRQAVRKRCREGQRLGATAVVKLAGEQGHEGCRKGALGE